METVAVYCEHPVRTYGLKAQEGCLLLFLECPTSQLGKLADQLAALAPPLPLVSCGVLWRGEVASMQVCLPREEASRLELAAAQAGARIGLRREASVINLQGPHFGDRWGLAKEVLAGLEEAETAPLVLMGVTHTLQIALDSSASQAALNGLGRHFVGPEASKRG